MIPVAAFLFYWGSIYELDCPFVHGQDHSLALDHAHGQALVVALQSSDERFFCEAIPTFVQEGDCFVAKSAPRNDTVGELIYLQALKL